MYRSRVGFTLIELLVVIAIIAILAAILFPVFIEVKEKAKRSQCLSNIKQIGGAIGIYAGDANGKYPRGVAIFSAWPIGWFKGNQALASIYTSRLLKQPKVFFCPASMTGFTAESYWPSIVNGERNYNGTYCYWYDYAFDNPNAVVSKRVPRSSNPARPSYMVLVSDIIGKQPADYEKFNNHGGKDLVGGNVLYMDLHAKWVDARSTKSAITKLFTDRVLHGVVFSLPSD